MAAYFWVGGSGTWDGSTTTNWASSSGGAGGAGVPTSADTVTFNSASKSPSTAYTVTMGTGAVCSDMSMTGPTTGQVTWAGTTAMSVYGSFTLSGTGANGGVNATYTGTVTFAAASGTQTTTTNGVTLNFPIVASGSGTFTISGALTSSSTYTSSGTKATDFGFTTATFSSVTIGSTGNSVSFGSAGLVLTGSGTCFSETVSRSSMSYFTTSVISATSTSPKTMSFYPGNSYVGINQGGTGALTLTTSTGTGNINLAGLPLKNSVQPATISITGGCTLYGVKMQLNGTAGNLITLGSTNTTPVTLQAYDVGVQTSTYCSVSYITGSNTATQGGTDVLWRFLNSTNGGNNTNVTFASQYYWVGGSGTWDASTTTNWSLTSGGSGSAGVPTSADDVYFNTASNATAYTVTGVLVPCFNFTVTGPASGNVTFTVSSVLVYGNTTLPSSGMGGFITGLDTYGSYANTLTTNGVFIGTLGINGSGKVTLGSALSATSIYPGTGSSFDTSTSNYSISANYFDSQNQNITLALNASTITLGGFNGSSLRTFGITTGSTINAGTSTINITGVSTGTYLLQFGGKTFYNVTLNNGNFNGVTYNITDTGTNTFNTFTYNGSSTAPSLNTLTLSGNITATNLNLNATGTYTRRLFVRSDTLGTQRNIAWTSSSNVGDCDFRDINFSAGAIGANFYGDCGGNSGITFTAGKTVYWNLAGAQNWSATGWATSSGGTPASANFPLAQDTVVFDDTGSVTGTITVNLAWNIGTIDMSGRTSAMTLATSTNTPTVYGAWTNGSGTTLSGTGTLTFSNRSTKTINSAGKTFSQPITIDAPGGGIQLLTNNLTTSSTSTLTSGTLDLNNLTLSVGSFSSSNSNVRTIGFGTGQINITGNGAIVWQTNTYTGLTVTGTPTVNFTYSGSTGTRDIAGPNSFSGAGLSAPLTNINITAGSDSVRIDSASANYLNVDFTGFNGTWNFNGNTPWIYGNLTVATTMTVGAGFANPLVFGATSGTKTITTAAKTLDLPITFNGVGGTWSLQDGMTMGSTRTLTFNNGTLNLNGTTLTVGTAFTTAAGTKNLTFNGGTLVCPGTGSTAFNNAVPTGFTTTAGTGTGYISMTAATAKTFVGGGTTYNCVLQQGGAGELTISGTNSFADIQATSRPSTITFPAGVTTTVSAFTASGTAGNLLTLQSSSSGSQFTLSKSSGTVLVGYLSIQDSNAIGGAQWRAGTTSTFVSNVTGWLLLGPLTQVRARINSSGVLFVPTFNQLDEVSKSINSVDNNALYSNLFDETQSLDYNGIPVAQRKTADGKLLVSGYFDEITLQ